MGLRRCRETGGCPRITFSTYLTALPFRSALNHNHHQPACDVAATDACCAVCCAVLWPSGTPRYLRFQLSSMLLQTLPPIHLYPLCVRPAGPPAKGEQGYVHGIGSIDCKSACTSGTQIYVCMYVSCLVKGDCERACHGFEPRPRPRTRRNGIKATLIWLFGFDSKKEKPRSRYNLTKVSPGFPCPAREHTHTHTHPCHSSFFHNHSSQVIK